MLLLRFLNQLSHPRQDEARALLREAFNLTGDLQVTGHTLHVRIDPTRPEAAAPSRPCAPTSPPPPPATPAPTQPCVIQPTMSGVLDSVEEDPQHVADSPARLHVHDGAE